MTDIITRTRLFPKPKLHTTYIALAALFYVTILDVLSTLIFRSLSIREGNQLVRLFVDDTPLFITIKLGTVIMVGVAVVMLRVTTLVTPIWIGAGILGAAVIVNLITIYMVVS